MKAKFNKIYDASVEIIEIMKHAPLEIRLKYPIQYRKFFKLAASKSSHIWKYDTSKKLYEQNVSNTTKKILSFMYHNVFLG